MTSFDKTAFMLTVDAGEKEIETRDSEAATYSGLCDEFAGLFIRSTPAFKRTMGAFIAVAMRDSSVFEMTDAEELSVVLRGFAEEQPVELTTDMALSILGIAMTPLTIGGVAFAKYAPCDRGTTCEEIIIAGEEVGNFSLLLIALASACARDAGLDNLVAGKTTPGDEETTATCGAYRGYSDVSAGEDGVVDYVDSDPSLRLVYDVQVGTQMRMAGRVFAFTPSTLLAFSRAHAVLHLAGGAYRAPVTGDVIGGFYNPLTFAAGANCEDEGASLALLRRAIITGHDDVRKRYSVLTTVRHAAEQVVRAKETSVSLVGSDTSAAAAGGVPRPSVSAFYVSPVDEEDRTASPSVFWRDSLRSSKTIEPDCQYQYTSETPSPAHGLPPSPQHDVRSKHRGDSQKRSTDIDIEALEVAAINALFALKTRTGGQLHTLEGSHGMIHNLACQVICEVGNGATRKKAMGYLRGMKNCSFRQLGAESAGYITAITLTLGDKKFSPGPLLTIVLMMLNFSAIVSVQPRNLGVDTTVSLGNTNASY